MDIEIERTPPLQPDVPGAVLVKLIGSDKELKGSMCIYPIGHNLGAAECFRIEVRKDGGIFPTIDIRLTI